jgi:hypothetical protein
MEKRTRFEAALDKKRAVEAADKSGLIADSTDVRLALMKRVHDGEITLIQTQAELKKIKASAKKLGLSTRQKVYSQN